MLHGVGQKIMLQILDLKTGLFEHKLDKKICNLIFQNEGGWVKGRLELFPKFVRFGGVPVPLGPCIYPQLPHISVDCIYTIYIGFHPTVKMSITCRYQPRGVNTCGWASCGLGMGFQQVVGI